MKVKERLKVENITTIEEVVYAYAITARLWRETKKLPWWQRRGRLRELERDLDAIESRWAQISLASL